MSIRLIENWGGFVKPRAGNEIETRPSRSRLVS